MYTRCLFCSAPLGANDSIEDLPVGRRLAFDQARGRLWVVCRVCARWNLTPIDERWEAIEACERRYRSTRISVSSENIGLAQLREGLELVRIGKPLRREFAAWRYGRHFLRRHGRKPFLAVTRSTMIGLGPALALTLGPGAALDYAALAGAAAVGLWRLPATTLESRGEEFQVTHTQAHTAALVASDDLPDGWGLLLRHLPDRKAHAPTIFRSPIPRAPVLLTGRDARFAVADLLPRLNPIGGDADTVEDAVAWLDALGGPDAAFGAIARSSHVRPVLRAGSTTMATLHDSVRLALEMAAHETEEQRLLAGELSALTWMWRREERLAAIADRLGIPRWIEERLHRSGTPAVDS